MKPCKNRFYCNDCNRVKMLFSSESKAANFIKFNSEEMEKAPTRSYFCISCNGWHLTSSSDTWKSKSRTEIIIDKYNSIKDTKELEKPKNPNLITEEDLARIKKEIETISLVIDPLLSELNMMYKYDIFDGFQEKLDKLIEFSLVANAIQGIASWRIKKHCIKRNIKAFQEKLVQQEH